MTVSGPCALSQRKAHQFREPARQQRRMGAGAEPAPQGDAASDRQHVFHGAADFDALEVARPVQPEMRRSQPGAKHFRQFDPIGGQRHGGRQAASDIRRETGAGERRAGLLRQNLGQNLAHKKPGTALDTLGAAHD